MVIVVEGVIDPVRAIEDEVGRRYAKMVEEDGVVGAAAEDRDGELVASGARGVAPNVGRTRALAPGVRDGLALLGARVVDRACRISNRFKEKGRRRRREVASRGRGVDVYADERVLAILSLVLLAPFGRAGECVLFGVPRAKD